MKYKMIEHPDATLKLDQRLASLEIRVAFLERDLGITTKAAQ